MRAFEEKCVEKQSEFLNSSFQENLYFSPFSDFSSTWLNFWIPDQLWHV